MAVDALATLALGAALGISLAAPPGPILVLSADRAVNRGYWPGAIVALGASAGDGLYCVLMGVGVVRLLAAVPALGVVFTLVGAALMLYFALGAWKTARQPPALGASVAAPARAELVGGFTTGFVLALTSPFNFGWWLGAGTTLFRDYGALIFVGFFAAIIAYSLAFAGLVVWLGARVRGVVTAVSYASAVLLVAFALLLAWNGIVALRALG